MDKFSFELRIVESNPTYSENPRVFLVKKNQSNKIAWAFEIDEHKDVFLNTHFPEEESEVWLTNLTIKNDEVVGNKTKKKVEKVVFSKTILWGIKTFLSEGSKFSFGENSIVYPARQIDRKNRPNKNEIDAIEDAYIKNITKESLFGVQDLVKNQKQTYNSYMNKYNNHWEEDPQPKKASKNARKY